MEILWAQAPQEWAKPNHSPDTKTDNTTQADAPARARKIGLCSTSRGRKSGMRFSFCTASINQASNGTTRNITEMAGKARIMAAPASRTPPRKYRFVRRAHAPRPTHTIQSLRSVEPAQFEPNHGNVLVPK